MSEEDKKYYIILNDILLPNITKFNLEVKNNNLIIFYEIKENDYFYIKNYRIISDDDLINNKLTENKYKILSGKFNLYIKYDFFIDLVKKQFKIYQKNNNIINKKYLIIFDKISNKHKEIIESNYKFGKTIDQYIDKNLLYGTDTKEKDIDPFFKQFDYFKLYKKNKEILDMLIQMFKEFPKTNKEFYLYRGIRIDKNFNLIEQKLPFSCSLLPYISQSFIKEKCCLLKIKIPKNYPLIFLNKFNSWEEEVIVCPSIIKVIKKEKIMNNKLNNYFNDPEFILMNKVLFLPKKPEIINIYECKIEKNY